MKNTFVFDKSENDLLDLEEETVIKETGIDTAKVKESIMKEIKTESKLKEFCKYFSIITGYDFMSYNIGDVEED